ncbi:MAG: amidohydrolase, partial [Alphaproteobacteria bacterium]
MNNNDDWLSLTTERTLDPSLPICDPHHHLWVQRTGSIPQRYLLDDYLADTNSGHNVVSTIFIECGTNFDTDGPVALRPVGETQFAIGVAAM